MPIAKIQTEDGRIAKFEVPEGTTEEEVMAFAQQQFAQPDQQPEVQPDFQPEEAPFMAQVGRGMMDVYQGAKQLAVNWADVMNNHDKLADEFFTPGSAINKAHKSVVGALASLVPEVDAKEYNRQLSEELKLYNQGNPDFQAGRVLGSIATPLTLVPGGAASTFGGKVITGIGTGTLFSLAQPVSKSENPDEFFAQKGEQALWGAGFGAGIPVAGKIAGNVVSWVDEITKPLYQKGIHRDVAKFLKEYVVENKEKITNAIHRAIKEKDTRTVGQIIADTTKGTGDDFGGLLVRLEKDLARESDALKSLYARQSMDKRNFIDALAGTPDDLVAAVNKRAATAEKLYNESFKSAVTPDEELASILNNKFAKAAEKEADTIIEVMGAKSNTESLHLVKLGLDKQLAKTGDSALGIAEKKAVEKVKERLVNWLGEKNPAYDAARLQYQTDSLPINRMRVGQELRSKFINALGEDKPATFALAVQNAPQTIKKATGFPRYDSLDKIFSPEEVSRLGQIVNDLGIEKKAKAMATASKPIIGELPSEIKFDLPHILSRPIVVANHVISKLGRDKSKDYKNLLVDLVSDPEEFLRVYGGSSSNEKTKMAMDIVRRLNTTIAAQQSAREAGAE